MATISVIDSPRGSMQSWNNAVFSNNYSQGSSLSYPAPFLNYEKHLVPDSYKKAAELMCHYFFTDPNINSSVEIKAVYGITQFMFFDDPKDDIKKKWDEIFREKKLKAFNKKEGIDYFLYGTTGCSVYKPFERHVKCIKCNNSYNLNLATTNWVFKNMSFKVACHKCKSMQKTHSIEDRPVTGINALKDINFIKWNIFDLEPREHFLAGKKRWRYKIPTSIQNEIQKGDKWFIGKTPIEFIQAVQAFKSGKSTICAIDFDEENIMVIQRPMPSTPNGEMLGWGLPIAISALRDLLFKNTIRRAQAVLLYENILPFRIFSPAQVAKDAAGQDNASWVANLQNNYQLWRRNPQHIAITGIPVNIQQSGGDGKVLSMFPEMQLLDKNILKAGNTASGIIEGDMTFSGGSVALRVFENSLLDFLTEVDESNNWKIKQVASIIMLEYIKFAYMPFKTGDDPQQKQLMASAAESNLISKDSFLRTMGFDYATEQKKVAEELVKQQIMMSVSQAKAQAIAQKTIEYIMNTNSSAMNNTQMPIAPEQIDMFFQQMMNMNPQQQQMTMQQLGQQNPVIAKEVQNRRDLSPQAGSDFLMQQAQTPPELAQQNMESLQSQDPIKAAMFNAFMQAMSMYMPQQQNNQPAAGGKNNGQVINMNPLPEQKPSNRTG